MKDNTNLVLYSIPDEKFNNVSILNEIAKVDNLINQAQFIYLKDDEYLNRLKEKNFSHKNLKKNTFCF